MSVTHFVGMFERSGSLPHVARIEIPLYQRDYAQGRDEPSVKLIREEFLSALCGSLRRDSDQVCLDFVYGEVTDDHTLVPLDGQQRLTTLFLLHLYVAYRSGHLDTDEAWTRFSYATRPSAAMFCRTLVKEFARQPEVEAPKLSNWIRDQHWFLYTWVFDPTVQGMLVVIDAIATKFDEYEIDFECAWKRLTDAGNRAIWFHFLPIGDMGAQEDLYIKMNSRGKPLTLFENVKAYFEEAIDWSGRRKEFATSVDGDWSDLLWGLRREEDARDALDERFMRYFEFITDVCQWMAGPSKELGREGADSGTPDRRVDAVFGGAANSGEDNLAFLFEALNTWLDDDATSTFVPLYVPEQATTPGETDERLKLFFSRVGLFEECCNHYGTSDFSLPQTLLLYATLVQRTRPGDAKANFSRNVRTLRNLIQATNVEQKDMPRLIPAVRALIQDGELSEISGFNPVQVKQEVAKRQYLSDHGHDPELEAALFALEDHRLLRGSLAAFGLDVDAETFTRRARVFHAAFSEDADWRALSGALLAQGDYGWRRSNSHRQYGTGSSTSHLAPWRAALTGNDLEDRLEETRKILMAYLDEVPSTSVPAEFAKAKRADWLAERERDGRFDWRYYFVKYDTMRDDTSGAFHLSDDAHRFVARRLRPGQTHPMSKQRDPYLMAIKEQLGADSSRLTDPAHVGWMHIWLRVQDSDGVGLMCTAEGFRLALSPEVEDHFSERWDQSANRGKWGPLEPGQTNYGATHYVHVNVNDAGNSDVPGTDHADRVLVGVDLVRNLLAAVDACVP